jgi:hypothetical protein
MPKKTKINLKGKKFNRLLVLEENGRDIEGRVTWLCRCDCGKEITAVGYRLNAGSPISCGCQKSEVTIKRNTKHGLANRNKRHPMYVLYMGMKQRCYYPKNKRYKNYGGRGIKVCDRWLNNFELFLEDMGERPSKKHSLDRIDNNGDYEPSNCRWATSLEQQGNNSKNHWVEYYGEKMIIADLERKLNIKLSGAYYHLKRGKSIQEAVDFIINNKKNKQKQEKKSNYAK